MPGNQDVECPPAWRVKQVPIFVVLLQKVIRWFKEQTALMEALAVAVTFHVLLFPLIWFVGWALPWPKPPDITTVIEINLENWPNDARPEKIEELYNLKRGQLRAK